jgi:transcriptional regulator with XRE-family HTH domain
MQDKLSEKMKRLKEARKQMGMTLAALADGTGFTRGTFANVESGSDLPSPRLLAAWIHRLHLSEQWVEDGTGRMFRQDRAFFMLPVNEIKPAEARAAALRDHASIMLREAEQLELVIRESKAVHKGAGGDASEQYAIIETPDGDFDLKQVRSKSQS